MLLAGSPVTQSRAVFLQSSDDQTEETASAPGLGAPELSEPVRFFFLFLLLIVKI